MDSLAELRRAGIAPATEKEKREAAARGGRFRIMCEDDEVDPATEALGTPILRVSRAAGNGPLFLNTAALRTLPINEPGQQFSIEADSSIQPIRSAEQPQQSDCRKIYHRDFPSHISLESCEELSEDEDSDPQLKDCIEFAREDCIDVDKMERFFKSQPYDPHRGYTFSLKKFPLYHAHVIWNCQLKLFFDEGAETFTIILEHNASSLNGDRKIYYDTQGDEETRQNPPAIYGCVDFGICGEPAYECEITGKFSDISNAEAFLTKGKLAFQPTFDFAKLRPEIEKHPKPHFFNFEVRLFVPRSYFDLAKIIDLSELPPTVPDELPQLVTAILCGEKPAGADWAITVAKNYRNPRGGDTQQKTFYVHKERLAQISDRFQAAVRVGMFLWKWKDSLELVQGENRCLLPRLTANDMQVVIPLIYGLPVPLPESREATLVESVRRLFNEDHLKTVLAPQWERLICKRALALDPKQVSTFASVYRLLAIIWSFPRGWMPVAKRVAIGVMADTVHLNAGPDDEQFIEARWKEIRAAALNADDIEHWPAIKRSMIKHLYLVSSVLKYGNDVMPTTDPEADDVTDEELAGGDNQQKLDDVIKKESEDVAVEASTLKKEFEAIDVNDEEEWHDVAEEAGGSASARKSCAIS